MTKETTRVQMELTEKSLQRLKNLKEKTEASSYAEVTKNAYRLYERLIEISEEGITFCLKDKEGNIRELEIFT
jgi:IS1 family transposase